MLLELRDLSIRIAGARVLRGLSFELAAGETLGIVGESGSGKSMTALAIMGLLPLVAQAEGAIRFEGQDILGLDDAAMSRLRGRRLSMVFQEPMTSLNPVHRIGDQIAEGLVLHEGREQGAALAEARRLLERVGIDRAGERLRAYPHQLSGGQRQRVMIAMALACRPALLIADEPTSALDVTVQAELIALLARLIREDGMGLIVISHDLGVVGALARRALVLYGGAVMEEGETAAMLARPVQPYTRALLAALPGMQPRRRLAAIPGHVPPPALLAPGCPFFGRCPRGDETCRSVPPPQVITPAGRAFCHHPEPA